MSHPERGIVLQGGTIARTIQSVGRVDIQVASSILLPVKHMELHPRGTGGLAECKTENNVLSYGTKKTPPSLQDQSTLA